MPMRLPWHFADSASSCHAPAWKPGKGSNGSPTVSRGVFSINSGCAGPAMSATPPLEYMLRRLFHLKQILSSLYKLNLAHRLHHHPQQQHPPAPALDVG